jgi:hypothetical protein
VLLQYLFERDVSTWLIIGVKLFSVETTVRKNQQEVSQQQEQLGLQAIADMCSRDKPDYLGLCTREAGQWILHIPPVSLVHISVSSQPFSGQQTRRGRGRTVHVVLTLNYLSR